MKKFLTILLVAVIALLAVAGGYVAYVVIDYDRIEDRLALDIGGAEGLPAAKIGEEYTILTQNIGFGAYTPEFTFFMDGGKESRAKSRDSVIAIVQAAGEQVLDGEPDFVLFQEVDFDSTRSYHTDQREILGAFFPSFASTVAVNYHSAYLMWPLLQPHGASNSSIVTFSAKQITSSVRRSLPISTSFSKFLDLDRCYSVSRVPVEGGRELVLYNVHLSAYGSSDEIRTAQMTMLFEDMQTEYEKGNYCVCGGDFNHDFTGRSTQDLNGGETVDFGWAQPFPVDLLAQYGGIVRADQYTDPTPKPTCRNCDIPYREGNFTIIVDGFLVSENVEITYLENIVTGFAYSDHNPVRMKFILK